MEGCGSSYTTEGGLRNHRSKTHRDKIRTYKKQKKDKKDKKDKTRTYKKQKKDKKDKKDKGDPSSGTGE
jgi:ATP-dependent RNA helicase DBP3